MSYPMARIAEIAKIKGGKRLPAGATLLAVKTDHPYIRGRDIRDGKITFDDPVFISAEIHAKLKRYTVRRGDVCITIVGNIGDVGITPSWLDGANLTENAVKLVDLRHDCTAKYLSYALLAPWIQSQMKLSAAGAAQPKLGIYKVSEVEVPLPPKDSQRRIASILSAYDDLIENNTRRIAILEEMARRIYEEWFIHFRFQGHEKVRMVESALGLIPQEWSIVSLADFGAVITGKTPSKAVAENFGCDIPFIKTPDMHGNIFCVSTAESLSAKGAASQRNKTVPPNSLCVSCIGTAGVVTITTVSAQTNQQINSIILRDVNQREFLFFALKELKETINQYGANGATMVNLNKSKFENLKVVLGSPQTMDSFHLIALPMFDLIKGLQFKNANLRTSRDLLLPKLISGELDVSHLPEPEAMAA